MSGYPPGVARMLEGRLVNAVLSLIFDGLALGLLIGALILAWLASDYERAFYALLYSGACEVFARWVRPTRSAASSLTSDGGRP